MTEFETEVDAYIQKELRHGAMIWLFENIPFKGQVAISPLNSRPKKGSNKWRIIMDCSWPIGCSLNDGIDKDSYLGNTVSLSYPTVDDLACRTFELRQSNRPVYYFKEDMDRVFRQINACPKLVLLLGFRWRNLYYFDLVMVKGCRIALYICQRTTSMIMYIHNQMSYYLLNYVDNFVGAEIVDRIGSLHSALLRTLRDVGVQRSESKSVPPTQVVDFIGNLFDAHNGTIGITSARKIELLGELECWRTKVTCTCRQLESMIGKLQYISNCVRPGRLFISCLLVELHSVSRHRYYKVNEEMRKDIKWWYLFLPGYNATSLMWLTDAVMVDTEFAMDACLTRAGGNAGDEVFSVRFPRQVTQSAHITHLQLWAVIISVKLWGEKCSGKIVKISTDNETVSHIINSGRSQDLLLQKLLRELTWWLVKYQIKIKGVHLSGRLNRIPDLLSRWHEGNAVRAEFTQLTEGRNIVWRNVDNTVFKYTHDW